MYSLNKLSHISSQPTKMSPKRHGAIAESSPPSEGSEDADDSLISDLLDFSPVSNGRLRGSFSAPDILVGFSLAECEHSPVKKDDISSSERSQWLSKPRRKPRSTGQSILSEFEQVSEGSYDFEGSLYNDSLRLSRHKGIRTNDDFWPSIDVLRVVDDELDYQDIHITQMISSSNGANDSLTHSEPLRSEPRHLRIEDVPEESRRRVSYVLGLGNGENPKHHLFSWDFAELHAMEKLLVGKCQKEGTAKKKVLKALRFVKKGVKGSKYGGIDCDDTMRTDRGQCIDNDSYVANFEVVDRKKDMADVTSSRKASTTGRKEIDVPPLRGSSLTCSRYIERLSPSTSHTGKSRRHSRRLSMPNSMEKADADGRYAESGNPSISHACRPRRFPRRMSLPDSFEKSEAMNALSGPESRVGDESHDSFFKTSRTASVEGSPSSTSVRKKPRRTSSIRRVRTASSSRQMEKSRDALKDSIYPTAAVLGVAVPSRRAQRRTSLPGKMTSQKEPIDCALSDHEEVEDRTFPASPWRCGVQQRHSGRLSHRSLRRSLCCSSPPQVPLDSCVANTRQSRRSSHRAFRNQSTRTKQRHPSDIQVNPPHSPERTNVLGGIGQRDYEEIDVQPSVSVHSRPQPRRRSLDVFQR